MHPPSPPIADERADERPVPHANAADPKPDKPTGFRPWLLILAVTAALLLVPLWSNWYADQVSLPRYCNNPELSLQQLEQVLREKQPAGDGARKPYIIVAKLLFLIPQNGNESIPAYLSRVRGILRAQCQ